MNVQADGSYWQYGYDALVQVFSVGAFWLDETPVTGEFNRCEQQKVQIMTLGNTLANLPTKCIP
jgi:hypothetical protein